MDNKFTTQEVIEMASFLFDEEGYDREHIHFFLEKLKEIDMWDATADKLERVFDLIVG